MNWVSTTSTNYIEIVYSTEKLSLIQEKSRNSDGREDLQDGFYLCNLGKVLSNYIRWTKAFPRITPFYAVKCNPDPMMLQMLLALGTGFDCASKREIQQLLGLGARPDQVIYANPCKQASHVLYAHDNGVKLVVVDSEEELVKMKEVFPDAELVLRIQTKDSKSRFPLSTKFGASMELSYHLIDTAKKMDLNLTGISFHVGCQCLQASTFLEALQNARTLFDYAQTIGFNFNLLDIGGGFYGSDDNRVIFEEFASIVYGHINNIFSEDTFKHVRIIAEPGRYFAESAFTLATNIIAKKKVKRSISATNTKDSDSENHCATVAFKEPAFMYYITDGRHGGLYNARYESVTPYLLKAVPDKATTFSSSIWGPTGDATDRVIEHVVLPELEVSDWFIWHNMGAYNIPISSFFNGFNTTAFYYVISEDDFDLFLSMTDGKGVPGVELVRKNRND